MSAPDLYIAAVVTMMFVGGIVLVIREARHQSMVKKQWVSVMTEPTDERFALVCTRSELV